MGLYSGTHSIQHVSLHARHGGQSIPAAPAVAIRTKIGI
jgi:hypothetical protein